MNHRGDTTRKGIGKGFPSLKGACFILSFSAFFMFGTVLPPAGISQGVLWTRLEEGLALSEVASAPGSSVRDAKITLLKIDPARYAFKLLSASELGKVRMTAREWCKRYHLVSAINAGMYQKDGLSNVGYMKNFTHLNNPRLNSSYKAVLCFNRVDPDVREIQIADLRCNDFEEIRHKYHTFVQNIRLISCRQENVWVKQEGRWSLAVLGVDREGNVLFIFSETPYSGHDFGNLLLSLPISIFNAMYLEGGPEASLFLSTQSMELDKTGLYDPGLNESVVRPGARRIPNVIGVVRKGE